ncbi:nuclear transport factor 2 family protein [Psychrosphaera sp. B3R10]|uniref:nuclear transport factor 2 family protein n=1 Tax=unclassified Psychrosphaera TaxID=2641570 RepID=UPI001C08EB82|nr:MULTISPECIES: nuclear transport factor 2 family protein [unclassified Psychrosphaera]MBU2882438.1 nuclear transport factor 2 family protein [Psychrosphaera sp. I2R16]MBU2990259.1 nuclear transport factor 2 family protein [Psychrosphaera sp. B3R10]MDO6721299.1 nuclear transport factor 2 family protein [Psychrosphaera sp. 1_MG-2023]
MSKQPDKPLWLSQFIEVYSQLSVENVHHIIDVYHEDIKFSDPAHQLSGMSQLLKYFDQLYSNVTECTFVIDEVFFQDKNAAVYWTMTYRHRRLNSHKPITVTGHSKLVGEKDRVTHHKDYLDLGQMVYEHVPLIGLVIKKLKNKLSS